MKKLISVILIMTLLISLAVFSPMVTQAKSYADTDSKLQLLRAVGVLPSLSADKLKEGVSRADFAIYAGNLVGITSGRNDTTSYFCDVPADHWALDSINGLVKKGALTVGSDARFYPDREITLQEAVKIMLTLTGFAPFAEAKGGYPTGYMQLAYERDITDGISQSGSFTMADAVNLLYNAANMALLDSYAVSGNGVKYATDTDTILSVYHDVYRAEDVVTGVYGITINDFSAPDEGQVRIGETIYHMGTRDMYSYLGMYVEIFYKDNESGDDDIIHIKPIAYKNKYEDISLKDFNGFNESAYTISYTDSKHLTKTFRLSYGVCVVHNGQVMSENIATAFENLGQGSIRIIDTDRDSVYDLAIISEYSDLVVGHIDYEEMVVYDKYNTDFRISLDPKNDEAAMLYTSAGGAAKVTSLSLGDIVTVFKSGKYTRAYYASTTVKGQISEKTTDDDGMIITIASRFGDAKTQYRVDEKYLERSNVAPTVGMNITAKLDMYGKIAYMELEDSELMYGYLVHHGSKSTLNSTLQLKIFAEDGNMRALDCAERVVVDGVPKKNYNDILSAIRASKPEGDLSVEQIIRFSLNDEGQIKEIDTLATGKGGNDLLMETHSTLSRRYSSKSVRFGTTAILGANTVIFGIPVTDDITTADEDDFSIVATSFFTNGTSYSMSAYKKKLDSGFEDAVVYKGNMNKAITTGTDMFLISAIRYELDEYGDYIETIYGCMSGTMLTYRTGKEFSFKDSGYESGDIVRLILNTKGEVTGVTCVYKYMDGIDPNTNAWIELEEGASPTANFWEEGRFKTVASANAWSAFTVAYANVVSTNDNVLKLSRTGYSLSDVDEVLKLSSMPVIVIYDKSVANDKNKVYKGSFSDLIPGINAGENATKAFVRTEESAIRWIIIYK